MVQKIGQATVETENGLNDHIAVIDGATLSVAAINVGEYLYDSPGLAIEPLTNRIYLPYWGYPSDNYPSGVLAINGADNSITSLAGGLFPLGITVHSETDRIYITNSDGTISILAGPTALQLVPVTPCRVVDTRNPDGQFGGPPISGGTKRDFPLPQGACNIPAQPAAYSLNVTVVPQGPLGYLTIWPTGMTQPQVSTMNSLDGRVKANAAIVPAGVSASVSVYASNTTDVVLDINGYFQRTTASTLAFYPLTPCRVADTRWSDGPLGGPYLTGGQERDFPILSSTCGIPDTAQAYAFNITAVPHDALSYLAVWPAGQSQPLVSTLNAPTGAITANAALVPAGSNGAVAVFPTNDTDLVIDVNGYFAPPTSNGLSLYPAAPCRVLDTRQTQGAFSGTILLDVVNSGCQLSSADVYVLNATVVPQGPLGYLTLWPTTTQKPATSTLNAVDGAITSNMAIVPNIDGWLDAFASNPTQLILDGFSYFAP